MRVIATTAMLPAMPAGIPRVVSHLASGSERLVAAKADDANPTSVMATWIVARN